MLFPTIDFAIFFGIVFVGNWLLAPFPTRWRVFILVASYVFYGWWDWRFVFLLAISTACTIAGGRLVHRARSAKAKRAWLSVAVAAELGLLGWFKYAGWLGVNVDNVLHHLGAGDPIPLLQVTLPVGISFFTFMGLSYVIDIYRGSLEPSPWLDVAVFVAFFPHLVAGPIVRGSDLLPQIRRAHRRDPRRIALPRAAYLIWAGLFKKVVLSSYVSSQIVDPVFANPRASFLAGGPAGDLRVCGSDLLRLQRLHRYRHRLRTPARLPLPGKLRCPLHGAIVAGFLAALAHHLVLVAARLPLHPSRWQPGLTSQHVPQHHDHDGAGWPVARCRLDLHRLGGLPRRRAVPGPLSPGETGRSRAPRSAGGGLGARLATFCDVPARLHRLGVLPRHLVFTWHSRCSNASSRAGGSRPRW